MYMISDHTINIAHHMCILNLNLNLYNSWQPGMFEGGYILNISRSFNISSICTLLNIEAIFRRYILFRTTTKIQLYITDGTYTVNILYKLHIGHYKTIINTPIFLTSYSYVPSLYLRVCVFYCEENIPGHNKYIIVVNFIKKKSI